MGFVCKNKHKLLNIVYFCLKIELLGFLFYLFVITNIFGTYNLVCNMP